MSSLQRVSFVVFCALTFDELADEFVTDRIKNGTLGALGGENVIKSEELVLLYDVHGVVVCLEDIVFGGCSKTRLGAIALGQWSYTKR